MKIGHTARLRRKQLKKTLQDIANDIPGYDAGNLSRFERGDQNIDEDKLFLLAKALSINVSTLYALAENPTVNTDQIDTPKIDWKDIPDLFEGGKLPSLFTVPVHHKTGDLVGIESLNATTNDQLKCTSIVVGIHDHQADLYQMVFDAAQVYLEYANPARQSLGAIEDVIIVAWVISSNPKPLPQIPF